MQDEEEAMHARHQGRQATASDGKRRRATASEEEAIHARHLVVDGDDLNARVDHSSRLIVAVLFVPGHAADEAGGVAVVDLDLRDDVVLLRWRRAEGLLPSWVQPDEDGLSVGVERCRKLVEEKSFELDEEVTIRVRKAHRDIVASAMCMMADMAVSTASWLGSHVMICSFMTKSFSEPSYMWTFMA